MRFRIISLLILLIANYAVFAQEDFTKMYYPKINQAELFIINGDYKSAAEAYNSAFKSISKPFATDYINALFCCVLDNDFENAKPILIKLAQKGISPEQIENNELFKVSQYKEQWQKLRFTYYQIYDEFTPKLKHPIFAELDSLKKLVADSFQEKYITAELNDNSKTDSVFVKLKDWNNYLINSKDFITSLKPIEERIAENLNIDNQIKELNKKAKDLFIKSIIDNSVEFEDNTFTYTEFRGQDKLFNWMAYFRDNDLLTNNRYNFVFKNKLTIKNGYNYRLSPNSIFTNYSSGAYFKNFTATERNLVLSFIKKSVMAGKIKPEYAVNLIENPDVYFKSNIKISKITIEDISECKDQMANMNYKYFMNDTNLSPTELEAYESFQNEWHVNSIEDRRSKAIFNFKGNQDFIISDNPRIEEITVPSCYSANIILKDAIIIN